MFNIISSQNYLATRNCEVPDFYGNIPAKILSIGNKENIIKFVNSNTPATGTKIDKVISLEAAV